MFPQPKPTQPKGSRNRDQPNIQIRGFADITIKIPSLSFHKPCYLVRELYVRLPILKAYLRYIRPGSLFSFEVDLHVIGHVVDAWDHHVSSRMGISSNPKYSKRNVTPAVRPGEVYMIPVIIVGSGRWYWK